MFIAVAKQLMIVTVI